MIDMKKRIIILADFGGPRSIGEIESFLMELLTDQDVVRTNLWPFVHRFLFRRVARKRAKKIAHDYEKIGGKSPIFENTESLREILENELKTKVLAFHRYIPETHSSFFNTLHQYSDHEIHVVSMFPQFTYATTGSCARFFAKHLAPKILQKLRWVKSYPSHPQFIACWVESIRSLMREKTFLLFSFHGVPLKFIDSGDLYLDECVASYNAVMEYFPNVPSIIAFQSQFGPDVWLKPSTQEVCEKIEKYIPNDHHVLVVPLSFTSDHVETLFEIEETYLPILHANNYSSERVPALNLNPQWIETLKSLIESSERTNNQMLIRPKGCKVRCHSCKKRCTQ